MATITTLQYEDGIVHMDVKSGGGVDAHIAFHGRDDADLTVGGVISREPGMAAALLQLQKKLGERLDDAAGVAAGANLPSSLGAMLGEFLATGTIAAP